MINGSDNGVLCIVKKYTLRYSLPFNILYFVTSLHFLAECSTHNGINPHKQKH